jgi:hypothetical protein
MPKEPFLIIEPTVQTINKKEQRIEGMINISYGGRSDTLVDIISTAMVSNPDIEMILVYSYDMYKKKKIRKNHKQKKGEPIQGELFTIKKIEPC